MPTTGNSTIDTVVSVGTAAITAASVIAAALPQGGPSWWVALRGVIDVIALNLGNAKNAPKA